MDKVCKFHQPLFACFIDFKKAYDSVHHDFLWLILKHTYYLPEKLLTIIRALHKDGSAAVRAYGKTSNMFSVTSGVHQGSLLAPTLFSFYFYNALHIDLDVHRQEERGIKVACLLDSHLVGNRCNLKLETLVTDLEYADDMAILAENWADLTTMLDSLVTTYKELKLTISFKKAMTLAALINSGAQSIASVQAVPRGEPIEMASHFYYLSSVVHNDCRMDAEVSSQICKASSAFHSLSHILRCLRKIQTSTKVRILISVILLTLLYGLDSTVLIEPHVHHLESFVIHCL